MLYIIRHGQTDWNVVHKLQGRTDISLNTNGIEMAEKAAQKYKDINFDVCYTSPLVRAYDTAKILLEGRNIEIIKDDRLKEMSFGIYEGVENTFEIPNCPIIDLFKNPVAYKTVEGGESFEELYKRTGDFIEQVLKPELAKKKDILVVGHGAMNCSIIAQLKGYDLAHFWDGMMDNCTLVKLL